METIAKLISVFEGLGCASSREAALCAQVYLELTEAKKYWDVTYKYDPQLDMMFCQGRRTKRGKFAFFVPVYANDSLCFEEMQKYLSILENQEEVKNVFLVFCTSNCTNVYYEITNGIGKPPEEKATKRLVENHRAARDKTLKRNIELLKEAAMCNITITLPKPSSSGSGAAKRGKHINKRRKL